MYIQEISLDGFKSYAHHTVVQGFDPAFNAITGLNGSGKSNILDSICFVLGITNLKQVRVDKLQELVYKNGQANITRASVSITFNNEDKDQSPVGYKEHDRITVTRQVVIGGRNKYLINGHTSSPSRVQNLFHSCSLNVNNPHFLIMQGRITKVLNMKPPEILGMVEEAAGTRMYEVKKQQSQKVLEKKQNKVEEIDQVLMNEISPTLEKLRGERKKYLQYQANQADIDRLSRFIVAFEYFTAKKIADGEGEEGKVNDKIAELQVDLERWCDESQLLEQSILKLTRQRQQEMSGKWATLRDARDAAEKALVLAKTQLSNQQEASQAERKALADLKKRVAVNEKQIESKQGKEKHAAEAKAAKATEEHEKATIENEAAQQAYQAALGGMTVDADGDQKTLREQLMDAQGGLSKIASEREQVSMRSSHDKKELTKLKKTAGGASREYKQLKKAYDTAVGSAEKSKAKLDAMNVDPARIAELQARQEELTEQAPRLRELAETAGAQLHRLRFDYANPTKSFDRSKVKGLLARLFNVDHPEHSTAIEVTAGGRLYNVVVDNHDTGKALLEKGRLRQRVTIIPLNKIAARTLDQQRVEAAKKIVGDENAHLALELIGYDDELEKAMQYVFGRTIVCNTIHQAKQVAFHPKVKTRTVTLDGDVFDPSGVVTGGSRAQATSILERLAELTKLERAADECEAHLRAVVEELRAGERQLAEWHKLNQSYELQAHQAELARDKLSRNKHQQLVEQVEELEKRLQADATMLTELSAREKELKKRVSDIEKAMKDEAKHREQTVKTAEKRMKKSKTDLQKFAKAAEAAREAVEQLELEVAQLVDEITSLKTQIEQQQQTLDECDRLVGELDEAHDAKAEELERVTSELEEKSRTIRECEEQIESAKSQANNLREKRIPAAEIKLQKLQRERVHLEERRQNATHIVSRLLKKHRWIENEEASFGKPKSEFDFSNDDLTSQRRKLEALELSQQELGRKINRKVLNMFDQAEREYHELKRKKEIIEKDKAKIVAVIKELDQKKNETLKKTWTQVNRDFGSIFSTLLPGTFAKLDPPEGGTVLDGLVVKVAFGDVWKESLQELSGGQRSLLALSLILALLLFKPAPMYILDEVDAALDLSHTQNIGQMLKKHFSHSQFIVVSLKQGLFSNANVLFKTKFVDGASTVTRLSNVQG